MGKEKVTETTEKSFLLRLSPLFQLLLSSIHHSLRTRVGAIFPSKVSVAHSGNTRPNESQWLCDSTKKNNTIEIYWFSQSHWSHIEIFHQWKIWYSLCSVKCPWIPISFTPRTFSLSTEKYWKCSIAFFILQLIVFLLLGWGKGAGGGGSVRVPRDSWSRAVFPFGILVRCVFLSAAALQLLVKIA